MQSKLKYLLELIDDDEQIFREVKPQIVAMGLEAKEALMDASNNFLEEISQERIELLIEEINFEHIKQEIEAFIEDKNASPMDIWSLLVLFTDKEFGFIPYHKELLGILKDAWIEIDNSMSVLENAQRILDVITTKYHFTITDNSLATLPESYYLHQIIISNITHAFTFSCFFWMVAYHCGLPLSFVRKDEDHYTFLLLDTNMEEQTVDFFTINCDGNSIDFTKTMNDDIADEDESRKAILAAIIEKQAKSFYEKGAITMHDKLTKLLAPLLA